MATMTRFYGDFKPQERLTLVLQAMARDDEVEAERLTRACPRVAYTALDDAFAGRMELAREIMLVACVDLHHLCGKMRTLRWVMELHAELSATAHVNAALAFLDGVRCGEGLPQFCHFSGRRPHAEAAGDDSAVHRPDDVESRRAAVDAKSERTARLGQALLLRALRRHARDLINAWEALDRFCQSRLGVDAMTLLRAHAFPIVQDLAELLPAHKHLHPEAEKLGKHLECLCTVWDRGIGGDG